MSLTGTELEAPAWQATDQEEVDSRKPAYPYQELADTDLRLLRILPGTGSNRIECWLDTIPYDSKPIYYALSYVWGDASQKEEILLEGRPFQVTRNLYEALQHMRWLAEFEWEDYFWIDAICINQDDLEERSRIVAMMMQIYHSSLGVSCWLGPTRSPPGYATKRSKPRKGARRARVKPYDRSDTLHQPVETPEDCAVKLMFEKAESMYMDWEPSEEDKDGLEVCQRVFGGQYAAVVDTVSDILNRPWFTRVWTLQEACLRGSTTIYLGCHSMYLDQFFIFIEWFMLHHPSLRLCPGSARIAALRRIHAFHHLVIAFQLRDQPLEIGVAGAICKFVGMTLKKQSTDPRDQLYGLLGLVKHFTESEELPTALVPNYRLPYEQVFWDYAAYLLGRVGDLRLLTAEHNLLKGVPSWVPDFRYLAIGTELEPEPSVSVSPDRRTLHVKGIAMEEIIDHVPCADRRAYGFSAAAAAEPYLFAMADRIKHVEDRILRPSSAIRGVPLRDTIQRVLRNVHRLFPEGGPEAVLWAYGRLCRWQSANNKKKNTQNDDDDDNNNNSKKNKKKKKGATSLLPRQPPRNRARTLAVTPEEQAKRAGIMDLVSFPMLLLADGTVLRLRRRGNEEDNDDDDDVFGEHVGATDLLVCLFKGAEFPSLVRPVAGSRGGGGEGADGDGDGDGDGEIKYTFLSQCEIGCGTFDGQRKFDGEFWGDRRDVIDFRII
ncbi:HET-domain-containing protein [Xylariomycetidae sp. FL2044]|nr:HET-domain-containing protein [Xylariomycetidae sp. FL2044]KAH9908752.1 HET-domain-containing protein [Xylariomycetidae sp. FL2044]